MKIEDILISDKEEMKAVWLRCLDTGSWAVGKKKKRTGAQCYFSKDLNIPKRFEFLYSEDMKRTRSEYVRRVKEKKKWVVFLK